MRVLLALLFAILAQDLPPAPKAVSAPPQGKDSFRFVVISDSNTSYGAVEQGPRVKAAVKAVRDLKPEFVCHAGDLIAGQKEGIPREQLFKMWEGYHAEVSRPLREAGIPLAPSPGNHDAALDLDREVYVEEWKKKDLVPAVEFVDRSAYPLYYSFRHKGALILMLDAARVRIEADQLRWIEKQLAAGGGASLRLAVGHIPLSKFIEKEHGSLSPKDRLYEVFTGGRLNLFFTGHYHVYYKGRYKDLNVVSTGILGTGNRALIGESENQPNSFIVVDVVKGKIAQVFALAGPDFRKVYDDASLPREAGEYRRFDARP